MWAAQLVRRFGSGQSYHSANRRSHGALIVPMLAGFALAAASTNMLWSRTANHVVGQEARSQSKNYRGQPL
jgi:hypothetical protein